MPTATALEATARDLQLLDEAIMRCVRQRDPERLVSSYYAPDAQLHVPGRPPICGRPAILDFWNQLFGSGLVDVKLETSQWETEHELACGVGRYALTMETHPGMLRVDRGKYAVVYRRQADGHWRAIVDSFSLNS
jgi:ketosteroid isomerase-like protein